jgi:hypothetical protein
MGGLMESSGTKRARSRAADAAKEAQKKEDVRLAEADDEVARSKAASTSKKGGRQSLIKSTAGAGQATNLGGTT